MRHDLPEPFRIGVRPLGDAPWLCVDELLESRLDEKARLLAMPSGATSEASNEAACGTAPGAAPEQALGMVHGAIEGTGTGAREALAHVAAWLLAHAGATHTAIAPAPGTDGMSVSGDGVTRVDVRVRGRPRVPAAATPLVRAASLLAEDLALMSHRDGHWVLAAACIAFPSAWDLRTKLGAPLADVHAPVPGYGRGTRNAALIERMFDALRPGQPVRRGNWSLHDSDTLHLPRHADDHAARLAALPPARRWLRHERQTLTRLPESGDVLFTVHTTFTRVGDLDAEARAVLEAQLEALDRRQRDYRSLP